VESYLERCLSSLCDQTCHSIEIIAVNDGSTDSSAEILIRFATKDSRIKVITQKNQGLSAARNTGIAFASGEYIMFVDSDDYIDRNTCEALSKITDCKQPDLVVFGIIYETDKKQWKGSQNLFYKEYKNAADYLRESLELSNFRTFAWAKLYRKAMIQTNKLLFSDGRKYEDMYFCVSAIVHASSVIELPEYFYHYDQSRSSRLTLQCQKKDMDVLYFIELLYNNYYLANNIDDHIYGILVFRWVSSCIIYKYSLLYFRVKDAGEIIDITLENRYFKFAAKTCAVLTDIPKRDRIPAKILAINKFLYKIFAFLLSTVKTILS